jgi:hypothetical protein
MSGSNPISETVVAGVVAAALSAIAGAQDLASLRSVRQATVGEQSEIAKLNGQLKTIDAEFKAAAGALIGKARAEIAAAFAVREEQFAAAEELSKLAAEKVDMTAVATRVPFGARHPLSLLQDQISDVFIGMGWEIAEGPELEHEWFNFDALNFDADHYLSMCFAPVESFEPTSSMPLTLPSFTRSKAWQSTKGSPWPICAAPLSTSQESCSAQRRRFVCVHLSFHSPNLLPS